MIGIVIAGLALVVSGGVASFLLGYQRAMAYHKSIERIWQAKMTIKGSDMRIVLDRNKPFINEAFPR